MSKASVHTSVNAARMSACATMISIFYGASPKTKRHCALMRAASAIVPTHGWSGFSPPYFLTPPAGSRMVSLYFASTDGTQTSSRISVLASAILKVNFSLTQGLV
jgi:hypothetical protein